MNTKFCILFFLGYLTLASGVTAQTVGVVPNNGSNTVDLPLAIDYQGQYMMYITDDLPPGSNIIMTNAVLTAPTSTVEQAGGTLAGTQAAAIGSGFVWNMQGTGALAGYSRNLFLSLPNGGGSIASFPTPPGAGFEVHAAPRNPGWLNQSFDTDMFRLFGQITGDPDFDLLRITAGTDFGLPSPGHTTLSHIHFGPDAGKLAVDSFFDITYRIDFIGAPGGSLAGMSGSTTGTTRFVAIPEPATLSLLALGGVVMMRYRNKNR